MMIAATLGQAQATATVQPAKQLVTAGTSTAQTTATAWNPPTGTAPVITGRLTTRRLDRTRTTRNVTPARTTRQLTPGRTTERIR
jgi:hypothetical protein